MTARTIELCRRIGRPLLVIDAGATVMTSAEQAAGAFVREQNIQRLDVAGPRGSKEPRGYAYARDLIGRLIQAAP